MFPTAFYENKLKRFTKTWIENTTGCVFSKEGGYGILYLIIQHVIERKGRQI